MKLLALFALCFASLTASPIMVDLSGQPKEAAYLKANALLKECGWESKYIRAVQATYSMFPTLDHGCILVMGRKPWVNVATGDITGMVRNRPFTQFAAALHRVTVVQVTHGNKAVVMRGDNNVRAENGWFVEGDYQDTVYAIIRFENVPHKRPTSLDNLKRWKN